MNHTIHFLGPALHWTELVLHAVLVGLLVAVPLLFVLRLRAIRRISGDNRHWVGVFSRSLREGAEVEVLADGGRSLPERLSAFALSHQHLCPDALDRLLEAREIEERHELERGLGILGTVGSNAPFVGLTGTVLGILAAFQQMGASGQAGPQVMSAIASALVATAAGLLVAIPAVVLHNVLHARVSWILEESRQLRNVLVARSLQATLKESF